MLADEIVREFSCPIRKIIVKLLLVEAVTSIDMFASMRTELLQLINEYG